MRRFEEKTVMITGCNRGIGKAILLEFAKEGANIIACIRKPSDKINEDFKQIESEYGISITQLHFDMSSEEEIRTALSEFKSWKLPLHVLVNNAGSALFKGIMQLKMEDIKNIFQVNFFSTVLTIQQLMTSLMKSKGASIINIGSVAGLDTSVGNCAYGSSKAAIMSLTKTLSKELAPLKIRVNSVAPGFIETDMESVIDSQLLDENIKSTALKRSGLAEEVANTVVFLASEEASYITGQIIRVDGGL